MQNITKVFLFLGLLLALLFIASYIFMPKTNLNSRANGILGEKDNTIDTIFVGDSLVYTSISPMHIFANSGITSYDLSSSAQYLYEAYSYLKTALEHQTPKVVFLETNSFFRKYKIINVIGAEGKKILPVFEHHNRWKNLKFEDFFSPQKNSWRDPLKGYRFMDKVNSALDVNKDYMKKKTKIREISKLNYRYIAKIVKLCQEKNIELILLSTPSMKNCDYTKYQAIKKIAQEFNLDHLDLNLDVNLKINWALETVDKGDHLNYKGAKKVSSYLATYLKEKGLKNHTNDSLYAPWLEDLAKYQELVP